MALMARNLVGPVTMLNLLRFREVADYSNDPHLAPPTAISGAEAYRRYSDHTMPHLLAAGGEVVLRAGGGHAFIGPDDERWDLILAVRQQSVEDFFAFATNPAYTTGLGHRTAALEDSRLIPMVELPDPA